MPKSFSPTRLIMTIFMLHSIVMTNWFPRIPDMQAKLQVGTGDLSLGLLGASLGTIIALPLAGQIVGWLSPRRTILLVFIFYGVAYALIGWAWSVPSLFLFLFLGGLFMPVVDVAMNVEADRIEASTGKRIMNTCHGFWSVGSIIGGLSGAAFASLEVDIRWHLAIVALVVVPIAVTVALRLPHIPAEPRKPEERRFRIALPTLSLLPLCIFAFGMLLVEAAALDWSSVFMRSVMESDPVRRRHRLCRLHHRHGRGPLPWRLGGGALRAGRGGAGLRGDRPRRAGRPGHGPRLPPGRRRACGIGLGVSVAVPLAVSAAASRGDRPAAVNVAALSLISFSGFLFEPPVVGFVAEWSGSLRIGLAMLIPATIASILLAGHVRRTVKVQVPPNPLSELAA